APLQKIASYCILFLSLICFFSIAYLSGMNFIDPHSLYGLNGIIGVTLVVSCFIHILNNTRYVSWSKSKQVEKRNNDIEEELKTARLLQLKLLPQNIPGISGYRFHPTYIPMDE